MEVKWRNVFLGLVTIYALINLPTITNNIAAIISSITGALSNAFGSFTTSSNSPEYDLARLCILLIFVTGIVRLLRNRKR